MSVRSLTARIMSQPRSWLRAILRRDRLEAEMEAELACHFENLTEDLIRSGFSPTEARRRARIAMGSMLTSKQEMRDSLGLRLWDELWVDLRYGMRILRKSPGFTVVATISLALAIGANATIFSAAKQLLYDRLDVPNAADLRLLAWTGTEAHVAVHSTWGDWNPLPDGRVSSSVFSYPAFQQLRAENRVLEDLFAFKDFRVNATVRGNAQRLRGEMVSGNYYAELGVQPVLGRAILPADDAKTGQGAVAVISYGLWEREFGQSPAVLGQTILVNNAPLTIVGVNPKGFTAAEDVQSGDDVFVPLSMQAILSPMSGTVQPLFDPNLWWVNIMARTKRGVSDATAQVALNTQLAAVVRGTMPVKKDDDLPRVDVRDGSRGLFGSRSFAKPMAVLMTLVGMVLLLACANIANLTLARAAQRHREMSVRLALGAGRARVLRQMLVESLMLASAGGAGGLLLAYLGRNVIPRMMENAGKGSDLQIHFDWRVFGFTAAITLLTGILFGLAPALAAARDDMHHGLKSTAQTVTRRRKGLGGRALVGFQIALSTLLVIGAGLFLRTLADLRAVDVGFRSDHLLLVEINLDRAQYPPGKDVEFHKQLGAAFAAVPGVQAATQASVAYISDSADRQGFVSESQLNEHRKGGHEYYNVVGNNFFGTLGIPIIAGRGFGTQDTATSLKVAVINQSLARKSFPNENPLGERFLISQRNGEDGSSKVWTQVVGVCEDTRYVNLRDEPPPQFFLPFVQEPEVGGMSYEIRTTKPEAILPALRHAVQRIDPNLPFGDVRTQEEQIDAAMQQERVFVTLTLGFGLLALALAAVGVYGIMAYSVAQRTHEIGIRLAVGAQPGQVRGMILRESAWLALTGVVAGAVAALLLARLVTAMLYGIRPDDPATMAGGALTLLVVALAATWIPARRAAGVQPIVALRHE